MESGFAEIYTEFILMGSRLGDSRKRVEGHCVDKPGAAGDILPTGLVVGWWWVTGAKSYGDT